MSESLSAAARLSAHPPGMECNPHCPGTWSSYHDGYQDGLDAARTGSNAALDVERLFRVLWETDQYWRFANDKQPDQEQRFRDWAAHIAREYAALASQPEKTPRVRCRCGRTVLPENWQNHLLRVSDGPHVLASQSEEASGE